MTVVKENTSYQEAGDDKKQVDPQENSEAVVQAREEKRPGVPLHIQEQNNVRKVPSHIAIPRRPSISDKRVRVGSTSELVFGDCFEDNPDFSPAPTDWVNCGRAPDKGSKNIPPPGQQKLYSVRSAYPDTIRTTSGD